MQFDRSARHLSAPVLSSLKRTVAVQASDSGSEYGLERLDEVLVSPDLSILGQEARTSDFSLFRRDGENNVKDSLTVMAPLAA
jgi:hypothetical protein